MNVVCCTDLRDMAVATFATMQQLSNFSTSASLL